jgi:hypothetical protein
MRGALLLFCAVAGCGRPFDVRTPSGFVELSDQPDAWAYRAVSSEGVVMGVRVVSGERGDLGFWTRAVTLQITRANGYLLTGTTEVASEDGTRGTELAFRQVDGDRAYAYRVRLFVAGERLFVAEAGGPDALMTEKAQALDRSLASLRLRCGAWLAPVLASRTCNRW